MLQLPAYLLPVLRLKIQGYSNHAIAEQLGYHPSTAATYVKRIIQFLKDEGWWDARVSSKTGLMVCGQRYLEALASSTALEKIGATAVFLNDAPRPSVGSVASASSAWVSLPLEQIDALFRQVSSDPYEVGNRYFMLAQIYYANWLCEEAATLFRTAEKVLGPASSQAAKASCKIAQMYLELGDLDKAQEEITRTQHVYEGLTDQETIFEWEHISGWVEYYKGNLRQAEQRYLNSLAAAQRLGMEHLSKHAHHFLGCIYCDWGQMSTNQQQAQVWRHQAELHFDHAYRLHLRWGDDGDKGYDLLRKAVLWRVQNHWQDAGQLRAQARYWFSTELSSLHVDLEEARLALINNQDKEALHKTQQALEGWAEVKCAKGIADALQLLGLLKHRQAKYEQAIDCYVAALTAYPYEGFPDKQQLWPNIAAILWQEDGKAAKKHVERIEDSFQAGSGVFAYLKHLAADRKAATIQITDQLLSLLASASSCQ